MKREHTSFHTSTDTLARMGMRMNRLAVFARFRHRSDNLIGAEVLGLRARKSRARNAAGGHLDPINPTLDLHAYGPAHLICAVDDHSEGLVAFHAHPCWSTVKKPGWAGQDGTSSNDVWAGDHPLGYTVADRRTNIAAATAIADGGESGFQDMRRITRSFQCIELHTLLELQLPHVGLIAVVGEMCVCIDQTGHDGEPGDVDHAGIATVAKPARWSHRLDLPVLHHEACTGHRLAASPVDHASAEQHRLHLDRVPCLTGQSGAR